MKKTCFTIGIALLSSVALPLYAQVGCVNSPEIQQRSLLSWAPQVHFSSPSRTYQGSSNSSKVNNRITPIFPLYSLSWSPEANMYVNSSGRR